MHLSQNFFETLSSIDKLFVIWKLVVSKFFKNINQSLYYFGDSGLRIVQNLIQHNAAKFLHLVRGVVKNPSN